MLDNCHFLFTHRQTAKELQQSQIARLESRISLLDTSDGSVLQESSASQLDVAKVKHCCHKNNHHQDTGNANPNPRKLMLLETDETETPF